MLKQIKIFEIEAKGFLHSQIDECKYDLLKKTFIIKLSGADLKLGGLFYNCILEITDWWDLEVIEKGKNVYKKYTANDLPTDIEQIIRYEYDVDVLTLLSCGTLDIDTVVYYKFTKPKIKITGEYEPD